VNRKLVGYLTIWWLPHALGYVVAPNVLAAGAEHVGGSVGPGPWSIAGVPFLGAGAFMIVWAVVSHYRDSPDALQLSLPTYLSTRGAYGVSRNPLYLGGALLWAGWAIAWLSVAVLGGGVALFGFFASIGIPYEERQLRARHGALYDEYCKTVPRWLALHRVSLSRQPTADT
jgi:protein-S-isoprenylcysteine O-methyltransferase Ste14